MSSWYEEVASYVQDNLETFIEAFFPDAKPIRFRTGIRVNPSPCCNHNDCFTLSKSFNSAHCFSCGIKGTPIMVLEQLLGQDAARRELESWSGIRFQARDFTPEQAKVYENNKRVAEIRDKAIEFYHQQLLNTPAALEKQIGSNVAAGQRRHSRDALKAFKVGYASDNYKEFYSKMLEEGYTQKEI